MKSKNFITLIILFVFLFSANSVFSQKDNTFNKKMYLGINGAYNFMHIFYSKPPMSYNIDLEFERQFSKHWGYAVGGGINHWMMFDYVGTFNNIYSPSIYLEIPVGMKFYSKILNVSMGINTQWLLRKWYWLEYDPAPEWIMGIYLTIGKDFTVFRDFKMEPHIQGFMGLYPPLLYSVSVGLRLKYEFNNKPK